MGSVHSFKFKKYKKLEAMQCWPMIRDLFVSGAQVTKLVNTIRQDFQEMLDIKPESLRVCLQEWKRDNIGLFDNVEVPETLQILATQVRGVPVKPDESFQILLAIQVDRLTDSYQKEKELGHLMPETNDLIRVALEITRQQSLHQARMIKAKRGNYISNKTEAARVDLLMENARQQYGEAYADIISNPDSRRRVLSLVESIMNKEKRRIKEKADANLASKTTMSKVV